MNVYRELQSFYNAYRGEKRIIGKSHEGRDIYAMFLGSHAAPVGIATYAMHAREWITAYLGMEHVRRGGIAGGVWVVPLVNPDGALLVQEGASSLRATSRRTVELINGSDDFSLWKANARAVDLNVNWDADWGTGEKNVFHPASENYVGTAPFSEPETRALRDFTLETAPDFTLSYHTKGEVVYWRYGQGLLRARRERRYAKIISRVTGYPAATARGSAGGYKDWCIRSLKIPAYTIEAGNDALSHPLGLSALEEIVGRNIDVLATLTREF